MHSFKTSFAAAALLMISVSAKDYTIVPSTVALADRRSWCTSQQAACPLLCMQNTGNGTSTIANDCDPETLDYECLCSNNLSPNMSEYSQTIPYFICVEFGNQCQNNCAQADTICLSNCRSDNPCGAQDPKRYNITSTSSSVATATGGQSAGTDGVVYNGFDAKTTDAAGTNSGSSKGSGSSGATMALNLGNSYGLAVIFTGIFAGFALVM